VNNVEIFKTDIDKLNDAISVLKILNEKYPKHKINFDLEDCDKILRMEGENIDPKNIVKLMNTIGHQCEILI